MAKKRKDNMVEDKGLNAGASLDPKAEEAEKFDFDAWFAMRENKIPRHHHKEILKADFRARGLEQCESLDSFDKALRKYGIKLD